jgi:hypothetical protein
MPCRLTAINHAHARLHRVADGVLTLKLPTKAGGSVKQIAVT